MTNGYLQIPPRGHKMCFWYSRKWFSFTFQSVSWEYVWKKSQPTSPPCMNPHTPLVWPHMSPLHDPTYSPCMTPHIPLVWPHMSPLYDPSLCVDKILQSWSAWFKLSWTLCGRVHGGLPWQLSINFCLHFRHSVIMTSQNGMWLIYLYVFQRDSSSPHHLVPVINTAMIFHELWWWALRWYFDGFFMFLENDNHLSRVSSVPLKTPEVPTSPSPPPKRSSRTDARALQCTSPAHHHRSNQELCYLCMQRSMRNVPVSFEHERRRKELEEDALLQQYQQMKDHEAILLEQVNPGWGRGGMPWTQLPSPSLRFDNCCETMTGICWYWTE